MSKQKGQGLVEFALILPLLLLMFFGIIEFGRIFQAYLTVQHAAREAARYAVTGQGGGTDEDRVHAIKAKALEATAGLNVDYNKIDWRECGCGTDPGCLYSTCLDMDAQHWAYENPGDVRNANALLLQVYGPGLENDPGGAGERVLVRVIYNLQFLTPFFSGLFPSIQLTGQMEMINEGFGVTGASHGGVLPPPLEPLPEMGPYPSDTEFTDSAGNTPALGSTDKHLYTPDVDLIYVTVTDKDENFYLDQQDTVTVIIRDDSPGGDSITLLLTEIANNAGVFRNEAGLASTSGPPDPDNGVLETGAGHLIIAEYTDDDDGGDISSDEARMTGAGMSTTRFTDSGGGDVTQYTIAGVDGIYVTVEDSDEAGAGTVAVTVTVALGDVETLTLTETGNPGEFRNTVGLDSTGDPLSPGDGTLQAQHCDTITAIYTDDDDPGDTDSDTATMYIESSVGSVAFDRVRYSIYADTIFVEVQDLDENENCGEPDQVTVIITNGAKDEETLILTETGPNTGVFNNTGLFTGPGSGGTPNNGFLEAQDLDVIIVTYTDDDDGGDTSTDMADMFAEPTDSVTSFTDSGGTDVSVYTIDVDDIYVTVQDGDENTNSSVVDTVSVTVEDGETGDSETLTLTETGPNTGVFRGGLSSSSDSVSSGNGTLNTAAGNTITANYADGSDTSSDTASMGTGSTTRLTDSGGVDVIQYTIGVDGIYVTVEDSDENTDSGLAETVSVTVTDSLTGDSERPTLTETGPDTGIFRNTAGLSSSSNSGSINDGTLNTAAGSPIVAVYVDQNDEADTTSDTATMIVPVPSTTSFTDNLGVDQDVYYLGTQLIYVTVNDADENLSPSVAETVSVTVSDTETLDSVSLVLYETGVNTGIFRNTGGLASREDVSDPTNNMLETQALNTIRASYTDDDDGTDTSSDTAEMLPSDQPPDLVVTDITVEDPNPALGDTINVTVTVRNQNMGSVTSILFDVDFYIYTSPDTPPVPGRPGDAKQWYTENVPGGTDIQLVYPISLTQAGTLYLYAQADTGGGVTEADETNNIYLLEAPYVTLVVDCDERFNDNMEGGVGGWTTQVVSGTAEFAWVEHASDSGGDYYHSSSHAWWVDDPEWALKTYLTSDIISVPSGLANVTLRFWHRMRAEVVTGTPYDGGWLEYNLDSGGWNDVTAAMFDSGGYSGQVADTCPTPNHEAWTGTISWQEVVANISIADTTVAHTIQFRWHFEADQASGAPSTPPRRGWWIDDLTVSGCEGPSAPPPPGSPDCVTAFQDSFGGGLSKWNRSDSSYVYVESGRLRLRTQDGTTSEEYAWTAQNIDLSAYEWGSLSYSWWTNALDGMGEWGQVRVSDDGGSTWTTAAIYYGSGPDSGSASILIGDYVSLTPNSRIEFRVQADRWQDNNYESFEVDNVVLEACNTVPIPDPEPGEGNISGNTSYYDPGTGESYTISGVDIWAWRTGEPAVYTYSLYDYTYGFYNLDAGTYTVYAEAIVDNDLYNRTYTVVVTAGGTTTRNILLTRVY